jgi:hypothetical protein
VSTEELERRMTDECEIALESAGDKPLTEAAIRTLAMVLIARHLGTLAGVLDHCRDGDSIQVNVWDCGKP